MPGLDKWSKYRFGVDHVCQVPGRCRVQMIHHLAQTQILAARPYPILIQENLKEMCTNYSLTIIAVSWHLLPGNNFLLFDKP